MQPNEPSSQSPEDDGSDVLSQAPDPVQLKLLDAWTPGFEVEFDPDEAERAGAFVEEALSEQEAADSTEDLVDWLFDLPLQDPASRRDPSGSGSR